MGSEEDKVKHSRRIRKKVEVAKKQDAFRPVKAHKAKESLMSGSRNKNIVKDKHGKKHDLSTMTHLDLVKAIQEG